MIQQKAKLSKLKTDDGLWDFSLSGATVGMEVWINCNSFRMQRHIHKPDRSEHETLMVAIEEGNLLPAETLQFLTEFRVKQ